MHKVESKFDKNNRISIIEREKHTNKFKKTNQTIGSMEADNKVGTMLKKIEIVSDGYKFFEAKILLVIIFVVSSIFLVRESMSLYGRVSKNKEAKTSLIGQYKDLGGNLKDLEKYRKFRILAIFLTQVVQI